MWILTLKVLEMNIFLLIQVDHQKRLEECINKHKIEITLVTTKMREEINLNLPALEDKLKSEFEERKIEEISALRALHDETIRNLEIKLKLTDQVLCKTHNFSLSIFRGRRQMASKF